MHVRPFFILAIISALASPALADGAANWPQFRGPNSDGLAQVDQLPNTWDASKNVRWRVDTAGRGWSSPVVWGDRVFLTTVVQTGEGEEPKKGLYFGGNRPKPPETMHQWRVLCLDLKTGATLWDYLAHEAPPATAIHLKNSFASETPVVDDQRLYAYFGNLGIFCLSHKGELLWEKPVKPRKMQLGWGTASSPVLHDGVLYIVNDNEEASSLMAMNAATGEVKWTVERDESSNWATPFVWVNDQRTELVTSGNMVRSYDLSGKPLWQLGNNSSIIIPTPFATDGLLYVASGYVLNPRKPVYAIQPGAEGDITLAQDETSNDAIRWSQSKAGPYNTSPLVYQGRLYVLLDRGFFSCYDATTGEVIYERKRLPKGRAFTASPWAYDGRIFCLNEYGTTYVIKAGPEFEILHTNTLDEDAMCMATPALVGNNLLIRTATSLYCLQEGATLER
ncbi:MAG: PQQ-binding-like beta-propeller repeat protein [Planctomycetes bacterium]|nr:PQQ-binding-like beta-propeller repeat protein [Planctomycetota bacterium]